MLVRFPAQLVLVSIFMLSCSGPTEPTPITTIQIRTPSTTLASGATIQLTAATIGKDGKTLTNRVVTWSSSNQSIATVSATGLVTAGNVLGANEEPVTITATAEGISSGTMLSVMPVLVSRILISSDSFTVQTADSVVIPYEVLGANGQKLTGRPITIAIADSTVGQMRTGFFFAKRYLTPETRQTRVIVASSGQADTASVRIRPYSVARLLVSAYDSAFFVAERKVIRAFALSVNNDTLLERTLSLTSATTSVARIDADTVTGVAAGRSLITVASDTAHISLVVRVDTSTTYTIPVSLSQTVYPQSYTTQTTSHADISSDPCTIAPPDGKITVPRSYLGKTPLPSLSPADRVPSTITRGILIKDVWDRTNPAYVRGCSGDARREFQETIRRTKELGADYLVITPWTFVRTSSGPWRVFNPEELLTSTMSDADLQWAVKEAHAAGLKIHWLNQIGGGCTSIISCQGGWPSLDEMGKFMAAYREYILERATLLNNIGVDVMQADCICYWDFWMDNDRMTIFYDSLESVVPSLKSRFGRKFRIQYNNQLNRRPLLVELTDYIVGAPPNTPLSTQEEFESISEAELAAVYLRGLYLGTTEFNSGAPFPGARKPWIFQISAPSRHQVSGHAGIEESFCTPTAAGGAEDTVNCFQRTVQTDFSIQAKIYQAQFTAVVSQNRLPIFAVEPGTYWMVDKLDATTSFPNIGFSPRNKPAEAIVRHWFRR